MSVTFTDYTRRMRARAIIGFVAALNFGIVLGCYQDPGLVCEDGECECAGNDCVCPSSGDCGILCTAECDLQCAGSGNCDFECGSDCVSECTGSGNCAVLMGPGSLGRCTGSGDCDFACTGPCAVECPGSGTCSLACPDNVAPEQCSNGDLACGPCA